MKRFVSAAVISVAMMASAQANDFGGFYIGAQTGLTTYEFSTRFEGTTYRFRDTGFVYGGYAGFRAAVVPNVLLGVEGGLNGLTTSRTIVDGADSVRIRNTFEGNAVVTAGYAMENAIISARLGYTHTYYRVNDNLGNSAARGFNGVKTGLALEYAFTQSISARIVGDVNFYERVSGVDQRSFNLTAGVQWNF